MRVRHSACTSPAANPSPVTSNYLEDFGKILTPSIHVRSGPKHSAMTATRAITSSLRCSSCRNSIWRSVAAFTGLDSSLLTASSSKARTPIANPRIGSISRRLYSDNTVQSRRAVAPSIELEELDLESATETSDPVSTTDDSVPWYLQVQDESPPLDRRLSERQELPDLPQDSPPLLQTLLERIAVDIGLDDLSLLDLRHLNPPSALGTNLMMIVGSARSEKHLHVAADRFCRYLRTEHKLRPHADGLLGRGELKIRMRRRAKRMKILAHAGALDTRTLEDELKTGWVCVMVDGIEPAPESSIQIPRREIIGFDDRSDKITLVVQMFTEAKRSEIELERLWNGRSDRAMCGLPIADEEIEEEDGLEMEFEKKLASRGKRSKPKPSKVIENDIFAEGFRALSAEQRTQAGVTASG